MRRTSSRRSRACAMSSTSWWSSCETFRAPAISFPEWKQRAALRHRLVGETPDLGGIVIGHGTASLEESAYFLNLTLKVPVVIVGSQRPLSGLASDAAMNLVAAVRAAASPASAGRGDSPDSTTKITRRAGPH